MDNTLMHQSLIMWNIFKKSINAITQTRPIDQHVIFIIPSSYLILLNCSSTRGFVKISLSWFSMKINSITTSLFLTWSHKKLCWISIYLVLKCWIGPFDKLIVLVLSHLTRIWSNWMLVSKCFFHPQCLCTSTPSWNILCLSDREWS